MVAWIYNKSAVELILDCNRTKVSRSIKTLRTTLIRLIKVFEMPISAYVSLNVDVSNTDVNMHLVFCYSMKTCGDARHIGSNYPQDQRTT